MDKGVNILLNSSEYSLTIRTYTFDSIIKAISHLCKYIDSFSETSIINHKSVNDYDKYRKQPPMFSHPINTISKRAYYINFPDSKGINKVLFSMDNGIVWWKKDNIIYKALIKYNGKSNPVNSDFYCKYYILDTSVEKFNNEGEHL